MELDRKELKYRARETMRLTKPSFWLVTLVYILLTTGVSNLLSMIPLGNGAITDASLISLFLSLALSFYTVIIDFGYKLWSLWTIRKLDPGMDSLIQGFSVAGRVLWLECLLLVRLIGFTFVLSFGISALSMTAFLTAANTRAALVVYMMLLTSLVVAAMAVFMLRYELCYYLLADHPELGGAVAIHRSVELMKGWKWEFFKLDLSFLGWHILSVLLEFLGLGLVLVLGPADLGSLLTGEPFTIFEQLVLLVRQPLYVLIMNLFCLPVRLWLIPYSSVTKAGFYDARVRLAESTQITDPFGPITPV